MYCEELRERWRALLKRAGSTTTPTGIELPRLALADDASPAEMARFLLRDGPPGAFPFATAAYAEMYLDGEGDAGEEPTRLFAGLGLAEDTNRRFHDLARLQSSRRLSTAFDGPTLYGLDSDTPGVMGKVGEGGVAIDTVEDVERLYAGFDLSDPTFSVSMTINGPAPVILAMYVAAARRAAVAGLRDRLGTPSPEAIRAVQKEAEAALRGTVQADILKEAQAQNEIIFPLEPSLRFLGDMVDWVTTHMPRWYPISISGYHIAEAGATPAEQAAFTLANGFTYVNSFLERGMPISRFGPRLSFFLDCGLDVEYLVLGRVCRRLWAIVIRDVFEAPERAQLFRLHTQTSGRSLISQTFQNNLTRTAVEILMANANYSNSCHSNSADEPFTTPSELYARLASNAQAIVLEESGLFRHSMNLLGGSMGMRILEQRVEAAILDIFAEIHGIGGVLSAVDARYFRSRIQESALRYERQVSAGQRHIIGQNRYVHSEPPPKIPLSRTPVERQREQVERVRRFKQEHADTAPGALDRLERVVESGGNVFEELLETVEHCTLGQITERLQRVVGRFRPLL